MTSQAGPAKIKTKPALMQEGKLTDSPPKATFVDRTAEAKACLTKAKLHLSNSRNTKTEIKTAIVEATDRLYQLVKEAETELKAVKRRHPAGERQGAMVTNPEPAVTDTTALDQAATGKILSAMEEHTKVLAENTKKIEELKVKIDQQNEVLERGTYASVTATRPTTTSLPKRSTLHSVVITSKNEKETGDQVMGRIREAIDAKEGWIKVDRVRKAKDRKVIMGFETQDERSKAKIRLQQEGIDLTVEEVKNRDPMLILKNVLVVNTDEDVLKAFRNQNKGVFNGLDSVENRVEVRYRRRTQNPHIGHVVLSVSPTIWRRALDLGAVHIDLQRVRVEDQSPLVQCTRCLGFGHGKRFCKEPADLCSHCGGPHMRAECADWLSGTAPVCHNCTRAKAEHGGQHNAFSLECPVRRKWDDIARSAVAYC